MSVILKDIIKIIEGFAPPHLAEEWDNIGLQVGQKDWPIRRIWIALDPLPDVVKAACQSKVDLLITHHPLIFKPLKSIEFNTPIGHIIHHAVQTHLSIFSAHTNLDSVANGVNDLLAYEIGLNHLKVLGNSKYPNYSKLVFYVPVEYEKKILQRIFETQTGVIGEYSCCSFRNPGKGTFKPSDTATPFIGEAGEISHAEEVRIEILAKEDEIAGVIQRVKAEHPYEVMAYDVYPLRNPEFDIQKQEKTEGLGRIGDLDHEMDLASFALNIKEKLGLKSVRIAGKPDMLVKKVAICSGSGSGLMREFLLSGAQVYVSGDLRYHDARDAEAAQLGLIDIGHFASEHLIVRELGARLQESLSEAKMNVTVEVCGLEKDPFYVYS
jgi:dinuclear metal center YbgI/SA1388 family protein